MSRVTVVDTISHQPTNGKPRCVISRFSLPCITDEEVYSRRIKVGTEWTKVDLGYVDKPTVLVLENEESHKYVIPSEADKAELATRIVEVAGGWEIHPGQSMRGKGKDIMVRARSGVVSLRVYAFPE